MSSAVLLDTHVFVWLMQGVERISTDTMAIIEAAKEANALYVSAMTPWEIALLVSKSRLTLPFEVSHWLSRALEESGIHLTPLSVDIAVDSTRLPDDFHSDPADRIIVATARHLGALLITQDRLILDYASKGHLNTKRADQ